MEGKAVMGLGECQISPHRQGTGHRQVTGPGDRVNVLSKPNPRVDALSCRMGCVLFGQWGFNKKGVGL